MPVVIDLEEENTQELIAAIIRQAVVDYQNGYTNPNRPDAAVFLHAAGLLRPDGTLLHEGRIVQRRKSPRPAAVQAST